MENRNSGDQINQNIGGTGNFVVGKIENTAAPRPAEKAMVSPTDKAQLLQLVGKGELKAALLQIVRADASEATKNQVAQLLGRLNKLEIEVIAGTLSKQDEILETNNIRNSAVLLISNL